MGVPHPAPLKGRDVPRFVPQQSVLAFSQSSDWQCPPSMQAQRAHHRGAVGAWRHADGRPPAAPPAGGGAARGEGPGLPASTSGKRLGVTIRYTDYVPLSVGP